ncbi:lytic transglycosylase domain-containing protein [Komagataeibacter melaceti]|uniref:Lytic transglycosylase domain-containing protein n=1 Tax=Komagataeibacter melaceti TaxID=2766577 RepID=A0A371Z4R5_9PROT|nr:lytic transglycosylase domain-containing protein [Komagataeibacter melaceti]RFD21458.1 lytic transglycosylase domain-containing protein [Komagataeibacter melaceti]
MTGRDRPMRRHWWTLSAAILTAGTPHAACADPYAGFVTEAATKVQMPVTWISAVLQAESAGNVHAVSDRGAMGLMQVMPVTWSSLRIDLGLGQDPFDPHDNILAGAAYLRQMHDRYGDAGFLAAYNAGPARYEDHLLTGRPLPDETLHYVASVRNLAGGVHGADMPIHAAITPSWQVSSLFPALRSTDAVQASPLSDGVPVAAWSGLAPQAPGLFVRPAASGDHP